MLLWYAAWLSWPFLILLSSEDHQKCAAFWYWMLIHDVNKDAILKNPSRRTAHNCSDAHAIWTHIRSVPPKSLTSPHTRHVLPKGCRSADRLPCPRRTACPPPAARSLRIRRPNCSNIRKRDAFFLVRCCIQRIAVSGTYTAAYLLCWFFLYLLPFPVCRNIRRVKSIFFDVSNILLTVFIIANPIIKVKCIIMFRVWRIVIL